MGTRKTVCFACREKLSILDDNPEFNTEGKCICDRCLRYGDKDSNPEIRERAKQWWSGMDDLWRKRLEHCYFD